MSKTFQELVIEVEKELSLVSGTAVQTYAEDEIALHLQRTFNQLFKKRWWDSYSSWQTYTLDGTVGIPNADISSTLKSFNDILVMFRGGTTIKIPRAPKMVNPLLVTGTTPLYCSAYPSDTTRVFRVYPAGSTGTVQCYVRTKPNDFTDTDVVVMDNDLLVISTAVNMVSSDGAGSLQLQNLEQRRIEAENLAIFQEQGGQGVPINPHEYPVGLTEWV